MKLKKEKLVYKMVFKNGEESIEVNILDSKTLQITYDEAVRILKQNKFNDDKFGSIVASYEGPDDEDPYWLYVEDVSDEDEYEMFDDYKYFYLVPATERGTEKITESNMEDNKKNTISREEKIKTLRDNTKFDEEQLKQMTDVDLNKMWDEMEGTDWMNNVDVESEHEVKLESKRQSLLSFEKFNEEVSFTDELVTENEEYPVTINLELKINQSTITEVENLLEKNGINCSAAEALHHYFLYNSGYEHDNTYGYLMEKWIEENRDDLQDL